MKRKSDGAKKRGERDQRLAVSILCVPAPDADRRLSRAIDMLLGSAARRVVPSEDVVDAETPHRSPLPGGQMDPSDGESNGRQ